MELNPSSPNLEDDCPSTTLYSHASLGCGVGKYNMPCVLIPEAIYSYYKLEAPVVLLGLCWVSVSRTVIDFYYGKTFQNTLLSLADNTVAQRTPNPKL